MKLSLSRAVSTNPWIRAVAVSAVATLTLAAVAQAATTINANIDTDGTITADGLITGTLGATVTGAAVSLNASSNFATNINTGTSSGALTLGGGSGTVAVNSSDWDISTTGAMTGIGAITADGLITGTAGATVTGAAVSLNASSNFGVNIATGTSTGTVTIGSTTTTQGIVIQSGTGDLALTSTDDMTLTPTDTLAIDTADWDISTTGAMTGIGAITADGLISATGGITQAYSAAAVRADGFSAAGKNVIRAAATTADLATITGGVAGQTITLIFDDAVVITDDNANGANAINLVGSGNYTTADDDTLVLVSDGTSWYELTRSVNN